MKAIIIDDSRLARQELRTLLKVHPTIEILDEAANAMEAAEKIAQHSPDLIFLDIEMPGKTGFELLEELTITPQVIFTTAFDEYALKSFEYNALDYLLKPVQPVRLKTAIEKLLASATTPLPSAAKEILSEHDQVFVKDGEQCWFIQLKKVRLFEIEGNHTRIFFEDHQPLIARSLNYMEQRLDPHVFFRANRQHIINLQWIDKIIPWFSGNLKVMLKTGEEIEISRRQANKFKELLSF
ncbi:LytR/AlgR family response regulator transcription factor [Microscilla marina]|uniref:Two-component system regulatory protein n=1 Tax=Microscilla marina ATCC 23134 TaxID=313606 RepID=A1ZDF9_MICM2|nr:LytTR family DNA-binding domain-containing protein [Microscilla marina]EAY31698.1 two-component system regulatory protein [Microscilla marina ATCC 23134]